MNGLEELEIVKTELCKLYRVPKELTIFEELDIIEKSLKALEIIKNKKVDVRYFMQLHINIENRFNVEYYNENCVVKKTNKLTKEEYDLLKEVLL